MKLNKKNSFYIDSQNELEDLVDLIEDHGIIGLDTEFTRRKTYYPILSIIQIAVFKKGKILPIKKPKIYVIDCLADIDLSSFFALISNPYIIKILHSARQDLQIFHHKSGLIPKSVIDTQIMANFCGQNFNVGYSNLVKNFFRKKIDKGQQISDWQRRPLKQKQIDYAMLDVLFLEKIYKKLLRNLKKKNRLDWLLEEMEIFIEKSLVDSQESLTKSFSFRGLDKEQSQRAKQLIYWREKWAKKVDVPRRHLIKDEIITKIVLEKETNLKLPKEMLIELDEIVDVKIDELDEKNNSRKNFLMNQKEKRYYQEAKKIISKVSTKEKLKEQFLISSFDLKKVICLQDSFKEVLSKWRYNLFGKDLEEIVKNLK